MPRDAKPRSKRAWIVTRFLTGKSVAQVARELWEHTAVWPEDPGDMSAAIRDVEKAIRQALNTRKERRRAN